ncbi:glycine betaine ABC transporter substrate-binding protein [Methanobrevibacter sp.]|uniref:ABC transporter permease/substrate-binding protein n=1 Tax=Methanobrevibacter sp. TaxID=66852 RepID=UPI0034CED913
MITDVFNLISSQRDFFINLTIQHLQISLISIVLAIIIGLGLGIAVGEYKRNKWILVVVNLIYTIPSIALFGFLIPVTGIGDVSAIIALTVYALLPMVRNTYTGITTIDKNILEAAEGMGATKFQILYKIKLPLAMPHIISAIRNMVIMTVALTGIAAFIGAGGLGVAIYRGITTNNIVMTVAGSLLIAILAIVLDLILGQIEKIFDYNRKIKVNKKYLLAALIVIILLIGGSLYANSQNDTIHVATKPMTEQYIMGYMLKEVIEANSDLKVDLSTGIGGGTSNIHPGMLKGDFDIYPEYTGTGWMEVLKKDGIYNEEQFNTLQKDYNEQYNITWVNDYGFEDTYGIAVTEEVADKYNLKTYSDLASVSNQLTFGAEYDFFEREDGYDALKNEYGMNFKSTQDMDIGLKYDAIKSGQVDVINIFTTDGRLSDSNVVVLEDDKQFYPSYECYNIVRIDVLNEHPELKNILLSLNNTITSEDMAKMNYEVEVEKKEPQDVAHKFLVRKGII